MATSDGMCLKELHRLIRTIDKLTTGQARIDIDDEQLENATDTAFILYITPNDGSYKGATCKFKVVIPTNYPQYPPLVSCLSRIYHPNIDIADDDYECGEASICVNLLDSDWEPGVGLDGCVMAILFLFYNPNIEDALSPIFSGSEMEEGEFERNVRASLRGETVEDIKFDKLISDEDDDENHQPETTTSGCKDDENTASKKVNEDVNDESTDNNQNVKANLTDSKDRDNTTNDTEGVSKEKNNNNRNVDENIIVGNGTNEMISNISANDTRKSQEKLGDISHRMFEEVDKEHTDEEKTSECTGSQPVQAFDSVDVNSGHQLVNIAVKDEHDSLYNDDDNCSLLPLNEDGRGLCASGIYEQFDGGNKKSHVERTFSDQRTTSFAEGLSDQSQHVSNTSTLRVVKDVSENHSNRYEALQTLDAAQLAVATKGHSPIIWHKTLSILGRFYRWLTGCTRRQPYEVYVVSRADIIKER